MRVRISRAGDMETSATTDSSTVGKRMHNLNIFVCLVSEC